MRCKRVAVLLLGLGCFSAAEAAESLQLSDWTTWTLKSRNGSAGNVEGWALMMHPDGRLSSSWVGPMYASEADSAYATLEGLESMGTYTRTERSISFRNDDIDDGWLWQWGEVTCQISEAATTITLSNCFGRLRGEWLNADPPQPPDLVFELND